MKCISQAEKNESLAEAHLSLSFLELPFLEEHFYNPYFLNIELDMKTVPFNICAVVCYIEIILEFFSH